MKKPLMLLLCLSFCLGLAAGMVSLKVRFPMLTALAVERQPSRRETIDKAAEAYNAAEPIFIQLQNIISDEMAFFSAETDNEPGIEAKTYLEELDISEAEADLQKMAATVSQFDELLESLADLPCDLVTSEGKTVHAVREYLIMLKNLAYDMLELGRYSIDLYKAILPLYQAILPVLELNEDPKSYIMYTEQLSSASLETQAALEKITPPAYLAISHGDIENWLNVFQDFSQDFQSAAQMDDPLRIYSCVYRKNRISIMFLKCYKNLRADVELQFRQAENRIKGPILLLHEELSKNLNLF